MIKTVMYLNSLTSLGYFKISQIIFNKDFQSLFVDLNVSDFTCIYVYASKEKKITSSELAITIEVIANEVRINNCSQIAMNSNPIESSRKHKQNFLMDFQTLFIDLNLYEFFLCAIKENYL